MKKKFAVFLALGAFCVFALSSKTVTESCRQALSLCEELIIPSLFPFFVLSVLLGKIGFPALISKVLAPFAEKLFNVSGAGASALIIGLTGGYPMGAAYITQMFKSGTVTPKEGEHLLAFCNNSGPAFIIGAVGAGVFSSSAVGLFLYAVHIMAAICTGVLVRFFIPKSDKSEQKVTQFEALSFPNALAESVRTGVMNVLTVCGFVSFFYVLTALFDANGMLSAAVGYIGAKTRLELHFVRALIVGAFELGGGIGTMRGLAATPINLALAAFMVGFGGLSVHFQTRAVLAESGAKGGLHFAGRLISASISALFAYFLCPLVL